VSIDTVIWDMGGIFQRFFTEVIVDEGRRRGWPLDRLPMGPTGVADDRAYRRLGAGELTEGDYLQLTLDRLHGVGITFDLFADPDWHAERRPEVWALIGDLAASDEHRQAILTNDASRWLGPRWWTTWPERHLFDVIVDVSVLGVRKPAAEPFHHVLRELDTAAGACIFVDDMPANCAAAERVGLHPHWFDITRPVATITRLRARIGM
jgi:FMN phosphatase YigB (HAD superfamily)